MSEISVLWEKLQFDRFTGGCHTPLIHAAIDRTLTTILFSFPSVQKKLPVLGGRLVCSDIPIQEIKFELHAGGLPFCYPRPHNYVRGARWLSGRVSDSGARGPGFETYLRRVVSLSKTLYSPKVLVNYPGSDGSVPT